MKNAIVKFLARIIYLPLGVVFTIGAIAGSLDGIDPATGTVAEGFAIFGYLAVGFLITAAGAGFWMKKSEWKFPPRVRVMAALLILHSFIFFQVLAEVIEKKIGRASNLAEPLHTMNEIFIMTGIVIPLISGLWILGKRFKEETDPEDPGTKQAKELRNGGWILILCGIYGLVVSRMTVTALYNMAWDNPTFLFLAFLACLMAGFGVYLVAGFPFGRKVEKFSGGPAIVRAKAGGAGIRRATPSQNFSDRPFSLTHPAPSSPAESIPPSASLPPPVKKKLLGNVRKYLEQRNMQMEDKRED